MKSDNLSVQTPQYRSLVTFINTASDPLNLKSQFLDRLAKGQLTRDENSASHFCAFFAGFDPQAKKVFLGHHIKGDRWLFNGGHLDLGETPLETVKREMIEEWGTNIGKYEINEQHLLTITRINNSKLTCQCHYDLWFFVKLNQKQFNPDSALLSQEFHRWGWKSEAEAKRLCNKDDVQEALQLILIISKELALRN
jgi:8-oxo-dGTP pyrophosphatase MutT (NUDIX family)